MKIMASSLIISWQIDGKTMQTVTDIIFLGSKITTDADSSHQNKRCLHFGRKAMASMLCWCAQSWPNLCDPMDYSPPGSSVHGIFQARILEWVAIRQHIKKQRHYFADKGPSSQSYGFSNSHVWMWELDYKESWMLSTFELWYWRRLLRAPWTARRSN